MPVQDAQVQGVTQQIMSQFQGMTFDQQWQVMQEVRRQMRQNITPEQRDQMRQFFRQQRDQGQMGPNNGRNRRQ
jgi:hypothetical protein